MRLNFYLGKELIICFLYTGNKLNKNWLIILKIGKYPNGMLCLLKLVEFWGLFSLSLGFWNIVMWKLGRLFKI
jgi:hypothetical protein